jgi:predicted transcriptional regulator
MKLSAIARTLALHSLTPELEEQLESDVSTGYASDLLSDVLAKAPSGAVLVTIQAHINTIAVALHSRLAAVILSGGHEPDKTVVDRAVDEKIPLFVTTVPTFELVGRLYALGIHGGAA